MTDQTEQESAAKDRAAKAREALARKRAEQQGDQAQEQPDPRLARTPVEREQARVDAAQTPQDLRDAERIRVEQTGLRPFASSGETGTHGVPGGEATGRQFVILHGAVGGHARGAVVHESKFHPDTDFDRLLDLGAVAPYGEEPEEGEAGERDVRYLDEIDPAPPMTLTDAAYTESPPTLPRTEGVATNRREIHAALREGVGTSGPRPSKEPAPGE